MDKQWPDESENLSDLNLNEDLKIFALDKFPPMADYVIPKGVRIADASRVRLGAYLGEGTTIMHEGFVNYNAGTEGPNMIEGRISAGVFIGKDSDSGVAAPPWAHYQGAAKAVVISVGERCLHLGKFRYWYFIG